MIIIVLHWNWNQFEKLPLGCFYVCIHVRMNFGTDFLFSEKSVVFVGVNWLCCCSCFNDINGILIPRDMKLLFEHFSFFLVFLVSALQQEENWIKNDESKRFIDINPNRKLMRVLKFSFILFLFFLRAVVNHDILLFNC